MKTIHPAPGTLLISDPFLPDPNFQRTVVYLLEHNSEGTLGLVLNHRLPVELADVLDDAPEGIPLFSGGPVEPTMLMFIHTRGMLNDAKHIRDGIFWGGNFEMAKNMLDAGIYSKNDIKYFVGYSGWSPGQLDAELEQKSWLVLEADASLVMEMKTDALWNRVLEKHGGMFSHWAKAPEDPQLN